MWEGFFRDYESAKKSTANSVMAPLITLLKNYPMPAGSVAALDAIEAEARRVSSLRRWFGANPGMKYYYALGTLQEESMVERRRIRYGADTEPVLTEELATKRARKYAAFLTKLPSDLETLRGVERAFITIMRDAKFPQYLDQEVGWWNRTSWGNWTLRVLTPAMAAGWLAKDLRDQLREMALSAGVSNRPYAEHYLLDLSIYCAALGDRADMGVVLGQASTIFGPLLGPLMAVGGNAVANGAIGASRALATNVGRAVATNNAISIESRPRRLAKTTVSANLMRFTHAWLKYITTEAPTIITLDSYEKIYAQFGNKRGCQKLYEFLSAV